MQQFLDLIVTSSTIFVDIVYYVLLISYYLGSGIVVIVLQLYNLIYIGCVAFEIAFQFSGDIILSIVADQLIQYACDLDWHHIGTYVIQIPRNLLLPIREAIIFISDITEFLIHNIFRAIFDTCFNLGDTIVTIAKEAYRCILAIPQGLIDVSIKYSVGIVVVLITILARKQFLRLLKGLFIKICVTVLRCVIMLLNFIGSMRKHVQITRTGDDDSSIPGISCVICQERPKCVLLLPCRHVCLCKECGSQVVDQQRICPLCRTTIYRAMSVYI